MSQSPGPSQSQQVITNLERIDANRKRQHREQQEVIPKLEPIDIESLYHQPEALSPPREHAEYEPIEIKQQFNEPMNTQELADLEYAQNQRIESERNRVVMTPSEMNDKIYNLKNNVDVLWDKVGEVEVNTRSISRELGNNIQNQKTGFNNLNFKIDQLSKTVHNNNNRQPLQPQPRQQSSSNLNRVYDTSNNNNPRNLSVQERLRTFTDLTSE